MGIWRFYEAPEKSCTARTKYCLTHSCPMDLSILINWMSISNFIGVWCTFSFLFYFWSKFTSANSGDPDQTPRSAASDLGLHGLPRSQNWDARNERVNAHNFGEDCRNLSWIVGNVLQCPYVHGSAKHINGKVVTMLRKINILQPCCAPNPWRMASQITGALNTTENYLD